MDGEEPLEWTRTNEGGVLVTGCRFRQCAEQLDDTWTSLVNRIVDDVMRVIALLCAETLAAVASE